MCSRIPAIYSDWLIFQVELLLASPLTRAIQTCEITFAPELERGLVIIAVPHAEEASDNPSDTGRDIEILRKEFPTQVDFNHVKHGWELHDGEFAVDRDHLTTRARKLRRWVRGRPEKEVVLVSHGFFNHYLTGDVNDKGEQTTGWWRETELRTYFFLDGDDDALIKETEDSIKQRKAEEDQEKMKSSQA